MFEKFECEFGIRSVKEISADERDVDYFLRCYGGSSLLNGAFTIFRNEDVKKWENNVKSFFSNIEQNFRLFGYDWQGNCYGVILDNDFKSKEDVVMFEIGTNQILSFNCGFVSFINETFIRQADDILCSLFFRDVMKSHDEKMEYGKCFSYKIPLFLGGEDTAENMEYSDMDVYWTVLTQVVESIRR